MALVLGSWWSRTWILVASGGAVDGQAQSWAAGAWQMVSMEGASLGQDAWAWGWMLQGVEMEER